MKFGGDKKRLASRVDQARRLLVARQYQEACDFLEEAFTQFPEDPELRLLYATVLLELRPDDVAPQAAKAVELGRHDPIILVRAAGLLLNRGDVDRARSCLRIARELVEPNFLLMAGLLNREGILARFDKDFDLAEAKLSAAVEMEPTSEPFVSDLARLLAARGRSTEAVKVIDQALPRVKDGRDLEDLRRELVGATGSN